jgi:hypothetical protein
MSGFDPIITAHVQLDEKDVPVPVHVEECVSPKKRLDKALALSESRSTEHRPTFHEVKFAIAG